MNTCPERACKRVVSIYTLLELNILQREAVIVSYTQRRTETVIYSPLKPWPALLLLLVKTFLTLAVTFTSLVYFMNENTLSRDYYGLRRHVMQT